MAVFLEVARLLLVFDDSDFGETADSDDFASDNSTFDVRSTNSGIGTIVDEEYLVKGDRVPLFNLSRKFLDAECIADSNRILLAASSNDCELL